MSRDNDRAPCLYRYIITTFFFLFSFSRTRGLSLEWKIIVVSGLRGPDVRTRVNANEPTPRERLLDYNRRTPYPLYIFFPFVYVCNVLYVYIFFFPSPYTFTRRKPLVYGTFVFDPVNNAYKWRGIYVCGVVCPFAENNWIFPGG